MDPADMGRRSIVLSKYRLGEKTSSEKNDDASGAISSAVN
jgi:pilus assembly protein CpaD